MSIEEATKTFISAIAEARFPLHELEAEFRFLVIDAALTRNQGNQSQTAAELRIHRNTLARFLHQFEDQKGKKPGTIREWRRKARPRSIRPSSPLPAAAPAQQRAPDRRHWGS